MKGGEKLETVNSVLLRKFAKNGTEKQGGNQRRKRERLFVSALCYFSCLINQVFKYLCADENDSIECEKNWRGKTAGRIVAQILSKLKGMGSCIEVGWLALDRSRENSSLVLGRKAVLSV